MHYNDEIIDYINATIKSFTPKKTFPNEIYDSVYYSLFGSGKRVRPYITIAVCDMLGGDSEFIKPLFSSLEMIHTYSLIHDDLPCMDNDDTRRGAPTNHVVFGYSTALLAGDALLNLAYETLFDSYEKVNNKSNYIKACGIISHAAGISGMVGGQIADMKYDESNQNKDALEYIYLNKTGELIKAAALCGALSADITNEEYSKITEYAKNLGMLFQITDDILDMHNNEPEEGKMTYASVYGYEYVVEFAKKLYEESVDSLSIFGEKASSLIEFTQKIYNRKK